MIATFNIVWTHKEIHLLGKLYGYATLQDVELWQNGDIDDKEILARCIQQLPPGYFTKRHMDNYPQN